MFGPLDCHPMALPSAYHLFWSLVFIGPAIYFITPAKSLNTVIAGSFVVGGPVSTRKPRGSVPRVTSGCTRDMLDFFSRAVV